MRLLVVVKGLNNEDINVCIGLDSCDGVGWWLQTSRKVPEPPISMIKDDDENERKGLIFFHGNAFVRENATHCEC